MSAVKLRTVKDQIQVSKFILYSCVYTNTKTYIVRFYVRTCTGLYEEKYKLKGKFFHLECDVGST
jgi:hypothetical protein